MPDTRGDVRRGMLMLLVAVTLFPVMDAIAKELATRLPVLQITWGRYAFTVGVILPAILWRHHKALWPVPSPWLQLLRGLAQLAATFLFFLTLTYLPLADTVALAFLYPLVITLLSPLVLGETVGWRRHSAVAIGFLGALVIIRPGLGFFQPAALFGLGISLAGAVYLLITRRIAGQAPVKSENCWKFGFEGSRLSGFPRGRFRPCNRGRAPCAGRPTAAARRS